MDQKESHTVGFSALGHAQPDHVREPAVDQRAARDERDRRVDRGRDEGAHVLSVVSGPRGHHREARRATSHEHTQPVRLQDAQRLDARNQRDVLQLVDAHSSHVRPQLVVRVQRARRRQELELQQHRDHSGLARTRPLLLHQQSVREKYYSTFA